MSVLDRVQVMTFRRSLLAFANSTILIPKAIKNIEKPEDLTMWPPGSWGVVFTLSHWLRAVRWCADQNNKKFRKRRSRVSRPFLVGVGVRVRVRVRTRGWVGSTPVPRSYQEVLSAREREQPTAPKIRAANSFGNLR